MYYLRWLTSRSVRQASEFESNVRKHLNHQRDLLSPQAVSAVESGLTRFRGFIRGPSDRATLQTERIALENTAQSWFKPYAHPGFRENLVMLLEIAVLILGSRAFFVQPMVIPTGSAQPTLWGVTFEDLRDANSPLPPLPIRLWEKLIEGVSYYHLVAPADLEITDWQRTPTTYFPFIKRQNLTTTAGPIAVWFPPEEFPRQLGIKQRSFRRGEEIARVRVKTGDHLLVDRISYNFRHPRRGEIIVFRSEQHPGLTADTHYIKRLVGLPGEIVRIGDDRHSYINGRPLTTNDSGFERVYAFDPMTPPRPNLYSGHVNGTLWEQAIGTPGAAGAMPNFPNDRAEVRIRPKHYVTFGDNTMNSQDSRYWSEPDFPQAQVIGRNWMVFWPFVRNDRWNIGLWQR